MHSIRCVVNARSEMRRSTDVLSFFARRIKRLQTNLIHFMSRRIVEFYCMGGFELNSFELNSTIARRINSAQAILNAQKRNFKKLYPGNCIVCFIRASQVAVTCINTTSIAKCNSDTYRPNLGLNHSDTVVTYSPN